MANLLADPMSTGADDKTAGERRALAGLERAIRGDPDGSAEPDPRPVTSVAPTLPEAAAERSPEPVLAPLPAPVSTDPVPAPPPHLNAGDSGAVPAAGADPTDLILSAIASYRRNRLTEAERFCVLLLAREPNHLDALRLLALVYHRLGRRELALAQYDRALAVAPEHAETLTNRGNLLNDLGRPADAIASYDHAIAAEPGYADAHYNRAVTLAVLKRFEEALSSYDHALTHAPDHAVALNNRGNVLMRLSRFAEALASFDRALAIRSDYAEAHNNRGVALQHLKLFDAAAASLEQAIAARPDYAEAYDNRGVALKEMRCFDEALASHRKAQAIDPEFADAHWNEALLRLLNGDLVAGWHKYEWRWKRGALLAPRRSFAQPQWDGLASLYDRTILLHTEQGFGDAIQFSRYVPLAAARGARVILEVPEPLLRLMKSLGGDARIFSRGETLPPFDLHCPLMSMPRAFGTNLASIPAATPYLHAAADLAEVWERRLGAAGRPRIGIAWAGNPAHENDRNRSIELAGLAPLFDLAATLVSLQKELRPSDEATLNAREIINIGPMLDDFADTAAVIARLDLVVTVDTAVAHLAGALGRPVFILLPYTPDWRWLLDRDTSPWYPSARLFRQPAPDDWAAVVGRVASAAREFLGLETAPLRLPATLDMEAGAVTPSTQVAAPSPAVGSAPGADIGRAVAAYRAGDLGEAERICRAILDASDHFDARRLLGVVCLRRGQMAEALASFDAALALVPDHAETLSNRGNALNALDRFEEALESYDRSLALAPGFADAHYNRGIALNALRRYSDALASYDAALAIRPQHAETLNNRGNVLKKLDRLDEALASYGAALAARPTFAEALNNRGAVLAALKRTAEALECYDRALEHSPGYADALFNRGSALKVLGRLPEALASFDAALATRPDDPEALTTRGHVLMDLHRPDEALACYERALARAPDHAAAFAGVADCAIKLCRWDRQREISPAVFAREQAGEHVLYPLIMIGYADDPALQLACARNFIRHRIPQAPSPLWRGETWRNERIRLAYLSADFHEHPVAQLTVELIERHDRTRFEAIAISNAPDDGSALRARLVRAFDRFHDVRDMTNEDVARLIHGMQADIVIDLSGYTLGCRPEILACRPAPIQVSYLGFPGTLGADFIDYVIADRVVAPFDRAAFFAEKIVHLPDAYQSNESRRAIAPPPSRRAAGLPDEGFVFCCFNNHFKIAAPMFDIWMRLLAAVEGSVLWLSAFNGVGTANLKDAAAARGIDPGRLIFAPRTASPADHLARLQLAGLFLDTLPYNAHTTASDALWAGLPVVTCRGESFAARVATSLLETVGLADLVTTNLADYEALALWLATDPPLLDDVKKRLAANRLTSALFDGDRFRHHIESAYTTMWQAWQRGEPPQPFAVAPIEA